MAKVNPNEVLDYLTNEKGLSESHALGIMANIKHESGFDPNINEINPVVKGSRGGYGLFQHTGERRNALEKLEGHQDYRKQIDFALSEPDGQKYLQSQFESPRDASVWWTKKFERPANADQQAILRAKDLEGGDLNEIIAKFGSRVSDKNSNTQGGNYSFEEIMAQGKTVGGQGKENAYSFDEIMAQGKTITPEIQEIKPVESKESVSTGDYLKNFTASGIDAFGAMGQMVGEGLAYMANKATDTEDYQSFNPLEGASEAVRDLMSSRAKELTKESGFEGDLFSPSTWKMPDNPEQLGLFAASAFGSLSTFLVPLGAGARTMKLANDARKAGNIAKAEALTKQAQSIGMKAGAVTGALSAGGDQAGGAREETQNVLSQMTHEQKLNEVPLYLEAFKKFGNEADAYKAVINGAGQFAGVVGGTVGALEGGFIGKFLGGGKLPELPSVGGINNPIARRGAGALMGAMGEGLQEAGEKMLGQNMGTNFALGRGLTDDLDRDTFADFAGGAIAGGGIGVVSASRKDKQLKSDKALTDIANSGSIDEAVKNFEQATDSPLEAIDDSDLLEDGLANPMFDENAQPLNINLPTVAGDGLTADGKQMFVNKGSDLIEVEAGVFQLQSNALKNPDANAFEPAYDTEGVLKGWKKIGDQNVSRANVRPDTTMVDEAVGGPSNNDQGSEGNALSINEQFNGNGGNADALNDGDTGSIIDGNGSEPNTPLNNRPKKPRKHNLLTTLRDLGGVTIDEALDTTGESRFTDMKGGYGQVFKKDAVSKLSEFVEEGSLDEFIPPNARMTATDRTPEAIEEATAILEERIRKGESVLPYDVEQEIAYNEYLDRQQVETDLEQLSTDVKAFVGEEDIDLIGINADQDPYFDPDNYDNADAFWSAIIAKGVNDAKQPREQAQANEQGIQRGVSENTPTKPESSKSANAERDRQGEGIETPREGTSQQVGKALPADEADALFGYTPQTNDGYAERQQDRLSRISASSDPKELTKILQEEFRDQGKDATSSNVSKAILARKAEIEASPSAEQAQTGEWLRVATAPNENASNKLKSNFDKKNDGFEYRATKQDDGKFIIERRKPAEAKTETTDQFADTGKLIETKANQTGLDKIKAEIKANGIDISLIEGSEYVSISKIVVPKDSRNQGKGTKAIQDVVSYAESQNKGVSLTASTDFGGNKLGLDRLYSKLGFVKNSGRNRDFSTRDTYILPPNKEPATIKDSLQVEAPNAETAPVSTIEQNDNVETTDFTLQGETNAEILAKEKAKKEAEETQAEAEKDAQAEKDKKVAEEAQRKNAGERPFVFGESNEIVKRDVKAGVDDMFSAQDDKATGDKNDTRITDPKQEAIDAIKADTSISSADKIRLTSELRQGKITPDDVKAVTGETQEPAPSENKDKTQKAKDDLNNALNDLGDIFGKNFKADLTPEQEQKLIPVLTRVFDASFRLGYYKFQDAVKFVLDTLRSKLGDDVADSVTLDHLQGAYIGMAGKYGDQATNKREVINYETINDVLEAQNVNNERGNTDLEQNSGNADARNSVGQESVSNDGSTNAGSGRQGIQGSESQNQSSSGDLFSNGEAISARESSNIEVQTTKPASQRSIDRDNINRGSGDRGITGTPIESISTETVNRTATSGIQLAQTKRKQDLAEGKPQSLTLENIEETLPLLLEGQQEDVYKTELRFSKPDGYGMLFTNGTGTGKTYTGMGVIKRFANEGKDNILIVVPKDKILEDWQITGKNLNLQINALKDTKDNGGQGIVITTFANLGANTSLNNRKWDLVVLDEAHYLSSASDGNTTSALANLRALSMHPSGINTRYEAIYQKEIERRNSLASMIKSNDRIMSMDDTMIETINDLKKTNEKHEAELSKLNKFLEEKRKEVSDDVLNNQEAKRTRALFLSATPFAYDKNIDWANGYLFDYAEGQTDDENSRGYNGGSNKDRFFMQHFGYTMRYNKLTRPDAKVNSGLMERQFNKWLKDRGALSGRMLDVKADYDRKFILIDSAIGRRIDDALQWFRTERGNLEYKKENEAMLTAFSRVEQAINDQFDYLAKRYLLEAIKAKASIPIIKEHLALNRKVVVFHDYKKGGGFNPFNIKEYPVSNADESMKAIDEATNSVIKRFRSEFEDLIKAEDFNSSSPIDTFLKELPQTLLVNGDVSAKIRRENVKKFQEDNSPYNIILVQTEAGKEGISLHDTTGAHQRVLINLGQPTKPTTAIQQEGRIYRTGQVSNAIFRYVNTGTSWERLTFATTIAQRASTAENLALGEQARALLDAYVSAFEESDTYSAGHEGEGTGGKERDKQANSALTEYDRAKAFYFGTQKKNSKTKAQEGNDYYATPEPVGLKMMQLADIRGGERVLEPSAGHGAIARWTPDTAEKTAVEPSYNLRSKLAMVFDGKIIDSNFEDLNIINKYDAIIMNPPFGSAGKMAIDHLKKATQHLKDGGRVVALIPRGSTDEKFDKWFYEKAERPLKPVLTIEGRKFGNSTMPAKEIYKGDTIDTNLSWLPVVKVVSGKDEELTVKIDGKSDLYRITPEDIKRVNKTGARTEEYTPAEGLSLVADISLPAVTFERAGTKVVTRIVVIEKSNEAPEKTTRNYTGVTDINDLFDRMETLEISPRAKPVEQEEAEASTEASEAPEQKTSGSTEFNLGEFKHTKTKADLFVATIAKKVEYEEYKKIEYNAKQNGGYYSSYKGNGAIAGFIFPSAEQRQNFLNIFNGDQPVLSRSSNNPFKKAKDRAIKADQSYQALLDKADSITDQEYSDSLDEMLDAKKAFADQLALMADSGFALQGKTPSGKTLILTPSVKKDGKWQLSRFDDQGAISDSELNTKAQAIEYLLEEAELSSITDYDVSFSRGTGNNSVTPAQQAEREEATAKMQGYAEAFIAKWANRPNIQVVFDMDDQRVPNSVRMENARQKLNGATGEPEGWFMNNTIYVVASQMNNPMDIMRTIMHEGLGHYGLRGVFGDSLDNVLKQVGIVHKSKVDAKAVQYGLARNMQEAIEAVKEQDSTLTNAEIQSRATALLKRDKLIASEEYLAELSQTRPTMGFVRKTISAIRNWLRENIPFFKDLTFTDDDIVKQFIIPARNFVEKGGKTTNYTSGLKPAFSLSDDGSDFSKQVDDFIAGNSKGSIRLGETPQSLINAGLPSNTIMVTQKVMDKIVYDHLPLNIVKNLPNLLSNPVMVFNSATQEGSYVVMLDVEHNGNPLIVAIKPNGSIERISPVNLLTSSYDKPNGVIHKWINDGLLIGSDKKKALAYATTNRVQFPTVVQQINKSLEISVNTNGNSVNGDKRLSRSKPQTETEAFKKWFGDSKVVDENGNPLVVYHGTNNSFNSFDAEKISESSGNSGFLGKGFYFSKDLGIANAYADKTGGNLMPSYIALSNPFFIGNKLSKDSAKTLNDILGIDDFKDGLSLERVRDGLSFSVSQDDDFAGFLTSELKRSGFDGVVFGDFREVVAFSPSQIKSAIGNNGNFDPNNADIRFSRTNKGKPLSLERVKAFDLGSDTKTDKFIRTVQDKNIDLKRIQQQVKDTIKEVGDRINTYLKEEMYYGRTAKRAKDFLTDEVTPLIDDMKARGVQLADFEEYLWMRHAPERNAKMAEINEGNPDGLAGISTDEALEYMDNLNAKDKDNYEALAKRINAINKQTNKIRVAYQLESESTVKTWESTYEHYVPLMREDMDIGTGNGTGQGFSVKGNETKRATGSKRAVVDILSNIVMAREKAITRGEKNRVAISLIGLAKNAPNDDFWKAEAPPMVKTVSKLTGMVESYTDPNYKSRDNVIVARILGKDGNIHERSITFNVRDERAMKVAESFKNLDVQNMGSFLQNMAVGTRWIASVNTQYNPVFGMWNLWRDAQAVMINLQSTPIAGKQKEVLTNGVSALAGIFKDIRNQRKGIKTDTYWAQLWEEFQQVGGQTGYRDAYKVVDDRTKEIERALDPDWWTKSTLGKVLTANGFTKVPMQYAVNGKFGAKAVFNMLSDYNETLENAMRLSAYKTAIDSGLSKEQSASIAKNISVNFNRKGSIGRQMGAVFAFFNASVQGTARMAEALSKEGKLTNFGKQAVYGGMLLGVMQAVLLAIAGFDDDEPPEFIKDRNIVIPLGDGKYANWALPLGYNVLPAIGRITTEWMMGGFRDSGEKSAHLIGVLMDMFNPIGNSGLSVQTVTPSVFDPVVALLENRDWNGMPIYKEDFNSLDPTAGHTRSKDTATVLAKGLSELMNTLTGGDEDVAGALSPTPDQIDFILGQVTGGVGREISKATQTVQSAFDDSDLPLYKIPVAGRLIGDATGSSAQGGKYYKNLMLMNRHKRKLDGMRERRENVSDYLTDNPDARYVEMVKRSDSEIGKIRKQIRMMKEREADSELIKRANDRITQVMLNVNEKLSQLE